MTSAFAERNQYDSGFCQHQHVPRLFRAAGYRDGELLEKLIGLALTREDK